MLIATLTALGACGHNESNKDEVKVTEPAGTPVTITTINTAPIVEYVELNATSTFLQKNYVKANINGYIQAVLTQQGQYVYKGRVLFTLITKEARSIGNAVTQLDPKFKFSGINNIPATGTGYITQLNHQLGDYVQDGEQLAIISDQNSFAFVLNLPYELKQYVKMGSMLDVTLPDGTIMKGTVTSSLPTVDPASQTQGIVIKVTGSSKIPENLIAKVKVIKTNKQNVISVPKGTVLTNDVQDNFWVMELIDSNTAVKVPITKGVETKDRVEILTPQFKQGDQILLTGNFGLPDTAKVKVMR